MIVISCSLDSSLEQAKLQGSLQTHRERYQMFCRFDQVVLLTQDVQRFGDELGEVIHVPCAYSKFKIIRTLLSRLKFLRWFYFSCTSFLWLIKNRGEIAIVLSENVDSPTPFLFSTFFKIPFFIHYHYDVATQVSEINKHPLEGVMVLFLEKLVFKHAKCVWVTAAGLGEKAKALGAVKVRLVPNWVDFNVKPKDQFQEFAGLHISKRVLFVGRLHPVKRVHLLIEAFSQLTKVCDDAILVIIGDGEERQRLAKQVRTLGLDTNVKFLGFLSHENVLEVMKQSDVLVLPSIMEGNPRVLIEAMMVGLPIVATNVPGIRDMVQHAKTGYLVEQATPENLCSAMMYFLNNKKIALEIADNAHKFAVQEFSEEQVFNKIREDLLLAVTMYRKNMTLSD